MTMSKQVNYTESGTRISGVTKKENPQQRLVPGMIRSNFDLLIPIISKLLPDLPSGDVKKYIEQTVVTHNNFIKNLGIATGTSHWGKIRNYCILLSENRPAEPVGFVGIGKKG